MTKNVVTGEGGMILAGNKEHMARARVLALHDMSKDAWHRFGDKGYNHCQVVERGFKYNMMDIQAAIGINQLYRVENNWQHRLASWNHYQKNLESLPFQLPCDPATGTRPAYHLYTVVIDSERCEIERDLFLGRMNQHHIGTGVHYLSILEQPTTRTALNGGQKSGQTP